MNLNRKLIQAQRPLPAKEREEVVIDIADVLWSHGLTLAVCKGQMRKWFESDEVLVQMAIDHLEQLSWDHHEASPAGSAEG